MARGHRTSEGQSNSLAARLADFSQRLQDIWSELYVEAFRNAGVAALSIGQYRYLEIIMRRPGVTATELAALLGVRKPTVTAVLKALSERGLLTRERSTEDRRVHGLRASDAARAIFEHRQRMYVRMAERIAEVLEPARTRLLLELLDELVARL